MAVGSLHRSSHVSRPAALPAHLRDKKLVCFMIVEDNPESRGHLGILFQGAGFRLKRDDGFFFVSSEREAELIYATLFEMHRQPNIIFVADDCREMDGYRIMERIRAINPEAFVVTLSGEASQANVLKSRIAGANGFIVKPARAGTLDKYVQRYYQDMIAARVNALKKGGGG